MLPGTLRVGESSGPSMVDGIVTPAATNLGPIDLGALAAGEDRTVEVLVTVPRKGQLQISASLAAGTAPEVNKNLFRI